MPDRVGPWARWWHSKVALPESHGTHALADDTDRANRRAQRIGWVDVSYRSRTSYEEAIRGVHPHTVPEASFRRVSGGGLGAVQLEGRVVAEGPGVRIEAQMGRPAALAIVLALVPVFLVLAVVGLVTMFVAPESKPLPLLVLPLLAIVIWVGRTAFGGSPDDLVDALHDDVPPSRKQGDRPSCPPWEWPTWRERGADAAAGVRYLFTREPAVVAVTDQTPESASTAIARLLQTDGLDGSLDRDRFAVRVAVDGDNVLVSPDVAGQIDGRAGGGARLTLRRGLHRNRAFLALALLAAGTASIPVVRTLNDGPVDALIWWLVPLVAGAGLILWAGQLGARERRWWTDPLEAVLAATGASVEDR